MFFSRRLFSLLTLLVVTAPVWAQNGAISGTVLLSDGQPAISVTVQLQGTGKGDLTNDQGRFSIRPVSAGSHTLRISLAGHTPVVQDVAVRDGETASVTISLNLSQQELGEVVVRGGSAYKADAPSSSLRLAAPLIETPQNIQIITNKVLADQQVTSLSDGVIRNVSGVTKLEHWGDSYTRINMRGDRAAAFRDGMNITSTWGPLTEDMSFVDHIEFVKGPAGFMMANGDPSGIYNVVTKKPTGQTKGEASILAGSYNFFRSTLDLDGRFDSAGRVLYRLNLMGQTKGSFRPYEYNDRYSIAPVISFRLDDKTTLTGQYILQHAKMSNVGSYYLFSATGMGDLPRDRTFADPGLEPTVINDHNVTVNLQHYFDPRWKITAQASYFNFQQRGSSLWVNSVDSAGNASRYVGLWDASNVSKFAQVYLNGDVQTGGVRHRILAGLDLGDKQYLADWGQSHTLDTAGSFNIYNPTYGAPAGGYPMFDRSIPLVQRAGGRISEQYTGLYAQDELGFLDNRIRLTLAARYTQARNSSYGVEVLGKRLTPRVGLSVSADRHTSFYALYDQSFVPQSGIRRDGKGVQPVTGNNLEAGVKRDWADGRWNTTLSVYQILKNNQTAADPSNTAAESFIVQFGQTRTQGLELDIRGELAPGLSLIANYAYTDSRISRADTSEVSQATVGTIVPGFAKHTANGWLTYRVQSGAFKGIGINLGGTYLADRTTWEWGGETTRQPMPDYFRLDGGLSYERGRATVTFNVFNLLDEYLYSGQWYNYGGFYNYQVEAGRNLRLGVSYRF